MRHGQILARRGLRYSGWAGLSILLCFLVASETTAVPKKPVGFFAAPFTKSEPFVPNSILVRFKPNASAASINALQRGVGGAIDFQSKSVQGLSRLRLPPGTDVNATLAGLRRNPNVLYAQPDHRIQLYAVNDPDFSKLWGLNNTGQSVSAPPVLGPPPVITPPTVTGTVDADINAPEAWDRAPTSVGGAVVAVVDTGVDYTHPDLRQNMWVNTGEIPDNNIDDDGNGYVDDVYGIDTAARDGDPMDTIFHGTHVAGTIAAVGNNGIGVIGVAPQAKVLACNFAGKSPNYLGSEASVIECLDYVYAQKNKGVPIVAVNASWGAPFFTQALDDAIAKLSSVGVLFIAAAGNDATNNNATANLPANSQQPNVLSVAASDQDDALTFFTAFGSRSVHVAAPGWDIYSTVPGGAYQKHAGTSMAAPHVAGLAALLAGYDATRDWRAIKNLLIAGGTSIPLMAGKTISGRRIRAWDTGGVGSLSCKDQYVQSVIAPTVAEHVQHVGTSVTMKVLNINCANPAGDVTLVTTGASKVDPLILKDDGVAPDQVAGDGVYSGSWTAPSAEGDYALSIGNVVVQSIKVVDPVSRAQEIQSYYPPVKAPYLPRVPRANNAAFQLISGGDWVKIDPAQCFSVNLGGKTMSGPYYVTAYGAMSLEPPAVLDRGTPTQDTPVIVTGNYTSLPNANFYTLLAPFWSDHIYDTFLADQGVRWWYDCALPQPELVVEWKGAGSWYAFGNFDVQMIFKANSPVIEVQYINIGTNAVKSTIGMQVDGTRASVLAYETGNPDIVPGTAWQWRTDGRAPLVVSAGAPQTVLKNSKVTLYGVASAGNGATMSYQWEQTGGTTVTLSDATVAQPTFDAPAASSLLTFKLTVADDRGQSASSTTIVNVVDTLGPPPVISGISQSQRVLANSLVTLYGSGYDPSGGNVSYSWTQTGGAAVTLSGANGSVPTFTAPSAADTLTFQFTVTNAAGQSSSASATVEVLDSSAGGSVQMDTAIVGVNESMIQMQIAVNRVNGSFGTLFVDYRTVDGTAKAGPDYGASLGTLFWPDGDASTKYIGVDIWDDFIVEPTESFSVRISGANVDPNRNVTTVNVADNDSPGVLSWENTSNMVSEGGRSVRLGVVRTGGAVGDVGVDYAVTSGTATAGVDFVAQSGTLTWKAGDQTTKYFDVAISDDTVYEGPETVLLTLANAKGGATLGSDTASLIIVDNEPEPAGALSLVASAVTVGEKGVSATLNVSRSGGSNGEVSVNYTTQDGTASAGQDYTATTGTLTWASGDTAIKSIVVPILDDAVYEGDETLSVRLSGPRGGAALGTVVDATVKILEDDPMPVGTLSLGAREYAATENSGTLIITVQRTGGSRGAVSIDYETSNGTAVAGSDFNASVGTLRWADGDTQDKTIEITLLDDSQYEGDETARIGLYNATGGASTAIVAATIKIVDNDAPNPGVLSFQVATVTVAEGDAQATVVVERTAGANGVVSVSYRTGSGSAQADADFEATSGKLVWADGDVAAKSFTVKIMQDDWYEGSENARVELFDPTGGAKTGNGVLSLVIVDDDPVNRAPDAPILVSPVDGADAVNAESVQFVWQPSVDPDGDDVQYQVEYCTEKDFSGCTPHSMEELSVAALALPVGGGLGVMMLGLVAVGSRRQRVGMLVVTFALAVILSACEKPNTDPDPTPTETITKTAKARGLHPATHYYWRVIATDKKGGKTESAVREFTTAE